jgi:hypothetical protein
MRLFARIGTALMVMTAVAMGTAGVASAEPATFRVDVKHSTGGLAASTWGDISWSTSQRTVTISNARLFVRGGEKARVTWTAYQGSTQIGGGYVDELDQVGRPNFTRNYDPFHLTSTVPGGIDRVDISLYDDGHIILSWGFCHFSRPSCTTS